MLATAYDSTRLINVSLHVGEPLTDADVDGIIATIGSMAEAVAAGKEAFATTVVIAEANNGPNAKQRRRIGEAARKITRHCQVLVTTSTVVRAITTAIRWFTPSNERNEQATFATYAEARPWLIAHTGHSGEVFDAMLAEVRSRVGAAQSRGA